MTGGSQQQPDRRGLLKAIGVTGLSIVTMESLTKKQDTGESCTAVAPLYSHQQDACLIGVAALAAHGTRNTVEFAVRIAGSSISRVELVPEEAPQVPLWRADSAEDTKDVVTGVIENPPDRRIGTVDTIKKWVFAQRSSIRAIVIDGSQLAGELD